MAPTSIPTPMAIAITIALIALSGCGREEILHGMEEAQANQVLVALDEGGVLARSVEAIDAVVEARVHLALPPQDPLRTEPAPPPRAAVLVKVRPGARARLDPLAPGIQALVAGAVAGLDAAAVAVVIA